MIISFYFHVLFLFFLAVLCHGVIGNRRFLVKMKMVKISHISSMPCRSSPTYIVFAFHSYVSMHCLNTSTIDIKSNMLLLIELYCKLPKIVQSKLDVRKSCHLSIRETSLPVTYHANTDTSIGKCYGRWTKACCFGAYPENRDKCARNSKVETWW